MCGCSFQGQVPSSVEGFEMFRKTLLLPSSELTLKMASAGLVEVVENTQHSVWSSPES
jgi:hypothetical protein